MSRRAAASLPLAVVLLDVTAVAVLVPDIRLDLGSSSSGGQWVLNAYLLALAAPLPAFLRIGAGARGRPLAIVGAVALAAGALVCATADSTATLVAGRAVEGAATAALLASVAAPWSVGALASLALPALALALGPLVGGVFAEQNWWHVYFWAGAPLAAVLGVAALAAQPPERDDAARPSPVELLAFAAGLTALTVAFVQAEPWGWGWAALPGLCGALALGGVSRRMSGSALASAALAGCVAAMLFILPEYLQLVRNLSGLRSGILLLAVTLPVVTIWALSGWLTKLLPVAVLWFGGVACAAAGFAVLVPVDTHTRYAILIGALGLAGTGLGLAAGATGRLPRVEPPSVVALLAGATLGLAAVGAGYQLTQADERHSGATFEHALSAGVGWAAFLMIALVALATLSVWRQARAASAGATPTSSEAHPAAES